LDAGNLVISFHQYLINEWEHKRLSGMTIAPYSVEMAVLQTFYLWLMQNIKSIFEETIRPERACSRVPLIIRWPIKKYR
jgi:hypothetical protein